MSDQGIVIEADEPLIEGMTVVRSIGTKFEEFVTLATKLSAGEAVTLELIMLGTIVVVVIVVVVVEGVLDASTFGTVVDESTTVGLEVDVCACGATVEAEVASSPSSVVTELELLLTTVELTNSITG